MNTIIFKWDPSTSSFSMFDYLRLIVEGNINGGSLQFNWSAQDYKDISKGDQYYFIKIGPNGTGLIGRGLVKTRAWSGVNWSGKGHNTKYVDLLPEIFLNPDALPIITLETLKTEIPDVSWDEGNSGIIIGSESAEKIDKLWSEYISNYEKLLRERIKTAREYNDRVYWKGRS